MLLEEHVAEHRGNDVESAVAGFRAFWPRTMPSYVPTMDERLWVTLKEDHKADMKAASESKGGAKEIISSWATSAGGSYPILIVVGPEHSTPHAVAFLITQAQTADGETAQHECFYANTGLGALQCKGGRAIRTTHKWQGDQIIYLIEYARRTRMDAEDYETFVKFIMTLPGHTEACVNWTPDDKADRMLTLAHYAESDGIIVSFPQRGGTCTYNCILWLVGAVMAGKKQAGQAAAVQAEMGMKKSGIRALASFNADDAGCMRTRDCMRVMEAVAHTYAATAWCKAEVTGLNAAIAQSFRTMHTFLTNAASRSNYSPLMYHTVKSADEANFKIDLGPRPFASVSDAAIWAEAAYDSLWEAGWDVRSKINEPIFHAFVHKARAVLCVSPMPDYADHTTPRTPEDVVAIVTFLDRCRGTIHSETARGMLVRCARLAAAALAKRHAAEGTNPRTCSHASRLTVPSVVSSALPWVVEEHRALAREAQPLLGELIAYDDIKPPSRAPVLEASFGTGLPMGGSSAAPERVRLGRLFFEADRADRTPIPPELWAYIASAMHDLPRGAFNLAVLFTAAWGSKYMSVARKISFHEDARSLAYSSYETRMVPVRMRERLSSKTLRNFEDREVFHANARDREGMASYLRLSVDDMSTGATAHEASTASDTPARMAIVIVERESIVQSDVAQLAAWADDESAAWTRQTSGGAESGHEPFERMARARSMAYCATKYLEPSSRSACNIENLDAIVAEKASHREPDTLTRTMSAISKSDIGPLAFLIKAQLGETGDDTRLAMQYAIRKGHAKSVVDALAPTKRGFGEPAVPLTPLRMTTTNGASGFKVGKLEWNIHVRQPQTGPDGPALAPGAACRELVFSCDGGVIGAVSRALRMANVPSLHWQYKGARDGPSGESERSEIEVNGAVIRFVSTHDSLTAVLTDGRTDGRTYDIDPAPSEWSSLWYTTVLAAVFPVRERGTGVLSLAVFVCTDESHTMAESTDAVYFSAGKRAGLTGLAGLALHATQRGTHFVVPFDAAGVMPVCAPLQAHTLFCAYSRGSICAVRLLPMLAARRAEIPATMPASCIYGTYAAHALKYDEAITALRVARRARNPSSDDDRGWCIATLEGTGARGIVQRPSQRQVASHKQPESPMDDVKVGYSDLGVPRFKRFKAAIPSGVDADYAATALASARTRLEEMRAACRAKWRFWFGTVVYGEDERAAAFLASAIAARENLEGGDERLGVMMAHGCVEPYACAAGSARETFEAASGRFLTMRQSALLETLLRERRRAVQLNMGFGKSAVIVPMLVLELIQDKWAVIVTQPAHLVAPAVRIIAAAVASRPFVKGEPIIVSTAETCTWREYGDVLTRRVIVCSSSDLQGAISHNDESARAMYAQPNTPHNPPQSHRAHIADEIDETSDPLTCERSETVGTPRAHYDKSVDVLEYHRAVCELVRSDAASPGEEGTTPEWYKRLAAVHEATKHRKLNVNFGLVSTEGVYIAVPYRYAQTPVHDSRYSDVNAGGKFTAEAVLRACERGALPASGMLALRRALEQSVGSVEAHAIIELLTSSDRAGNASDNKRNKQRAHQLFMLYAVLVALPQVVCYEKEKVTSFLDVLGIADVFAAFSGTMALSIPLPSLTSSSHGGHGVSYPDSRAAFMPHRNEDGNLRVLQDEPGNARVEANIRKATCKAVPGAHDAKRAHAVIAVLEGLRTAGQGRKGHQGRKGPTRQMVVVDASGEFGVMPEAPQFLRRGRCFHDDGTLQPKTNDNDWLVYFDHRNSRGTDAEIDADADGWVVVDLVTSTITAIAQASYRLRGIDYGRQTVSFIVCGVPEGEPMDGSALYDRLVINDAERARRTVNRGKIQLARASRHYSMHRPPLRPFVHNVTHSAHTAADAGQHQQTQMQMQEQEQAQSRGETCLSVDSDASYYRIDPLVVYKIRKWTVDSALRPSLLETSVHVSPLLVFAGNGNGDIAHELAFVVIASESAARTKSPTRTTVGMCALMEIWARLTQSDAAVSAVSAYSARGKLLRGVPASAGDVLFGTFLCGRTLPREDQKSLLAYMTRRYADADQRSAIHRVLACLVSARLLTPHAGLLRPLFVTAKWAESTESAETADPVAAFVRSVMSAGVAPAFGPLVQGRKRRFV